MALNLIDLVLVPMNILLLWTVGILVTLNPLRTDVILVTAYHSVLNLDKKIWEDFNKSFISQLLSKKYYKHWKESNNAAITNIEPRY
jgi:hypothetical protein